MQCNIIHMGKRCTCTFGSYQAMRLHQVASKLPGHTIRDSIAEVITGNTCVNCGTVFGSRREAVQHLQGAWSTGRCIAGGTAAAHQNNIELMICHICNNSIKYINFKQYAEHMCTHIPPLPGHSSIRVVQANCRGRVRSGVRGARSAQSAPRRKPVPKQRQA